MRWLRRSLAIPGDLVPVDQRPMRGNQIGERVPAGHVLAVGDNLDNSIDSRYFGYIAMREVLGVAIRLMS